MAIYVVKSGDTVDIIAREQEVPVSEIIYDNQLVYPYRLAIGQALYIRGVKQEERTVLASGYAYPFISPWVLEQTLPYLSRLLIFSYGFTKEGDLIPPLLDESFMIELAVQYGVEPFLTLTPFDERGIFNNNLIHEVVRNEQAKQNLIDQLLMKMQVSGYQGVDVDFEYILAQDRDAFSLFVEELTRQMNEAGYTTSVALAPKTSATQQGLLYEGKDYRRLGEAANQVLLMTYEWGYTYPQLSRMQLL